MRSILRRHPFEDKTVDVIDRNLLDQQYPKYKNKLRVVLRSFLIIPKPFPSLTQSPKFIGFPSTITFAE